MSSINPVSSKPKSCFVHCISYEPCAYHWFQVSNPRASEDALSLTEGTCFIILTPPSFVFLGELHFMRNLACLLGCAPFLLAACSDVQSVNRVPSSQFIAELPDGVLAIAAPYQDLNAVRIDPADGCYVYSHAGPVETTFLPLRTVNGQPICTRQPEAAQTS